eukprot:TRINITY_DN1456_c0_g1_i1.p1 TRINITY_DN1456_c0_g1~~TRINITY_DN1456_c0_g1_i1.p1  ORF type:complete len:1062 (+),score=371.97 TRINITY_DN1456_c0_g1_i1:313-3498(+)
MSTKEETNPTGNPAAELDPAKKAEKDAKKKAKEDAKAAKIAKAMAKKQQAPQQQAKPKEGGKPEEKKKEKKEEPAFVNITPKGEKKDMSQPMRAAYEPKAVEAAWYEWWLKKGFFHADTAAALADPSKERFVIVIPPPNVTGSLHLGHALTNSVEDAITRYHRAKGRVALWVPGMDHAGIATQVVVEKKIQKEQNITRHDLGREKFVEKVWEWKKDYGGKIVSQLQRLGSSLDWEREVFTMDEKRSKAVTEAFVRFFESGKIYRDTRLVNWCCKLKSAISDEEVDMIKLEKRTKMRVPGHDQSKEYEFGVLVEFAYKVDGSDEEIIVATTRIETMLADTAVAVHPNDTRYKHLHGKFLVHPFHDRKIPIVTDDVLVDMSFGTGAVKVTPAHDPNDYLCGKRHNLPFINMLNDDGRLNENSAQFKGMLRFDAREAVLEELKKKGLYRAIKDNPMSLGICSRSKDVIEPIVKPQWYVKCKEMGTRAADSVRNGELEIIPPIWKDTWYRWMDNIHDWCISRQLWWGHRCPAYLVSIEGQTTLDTQDNWIVGRNEAEARAKALAKHPGVDPAKIKLTQDPDVLDTWFSSGLFPFSVFGWPDNTKELEAFYPTTLLETGHDIIFFWVARMVMMGQELTGKLPFKQVFLHAMVRDAHGRKMSKSTGNVIDPIQMIEGITLEELHKSLETGNLEAREIEKAKAGQKADYPNGIPECGTDATRFALCAYTSQGRDINLDVQRVAAYRNFCNKLWNATKFALMNLGPDFKPADQQSEESAGKSVWEKWILSRLAAAIEGVDEGFKTYDFAQATTAVYNFWLYELCDVFLESMKPTMQANSADAGVSSRQASLRETLYTCLDNGLRLLQPFMPFVSEELFQRIPRRASDSSLESVCTAPFPKRVENWKSEETEKEFRFAQETIKAIRSLRASFNLTKEKPKIYINVNSDQLKASLQPYKEVLTFLCHASEVEILVNSTETPAGCAVEIVNETCQVYMLIKGLVDIAAETEKLEKKKAKTLGDHERLLKQTTGPHYHKLPENLREENTKKLQAYLTEVELANKAIENYKRFA